MADVLVALEFFYITLFCFDFDTGNVIDGSEAGITLGVDGSPYYLLVDVVIQGVFIVEHFIFQRRQCPMVRCRIKSGMMETAFVV